jgi:hypothetical protein
MHPDFGCFIARERHAELGKLVASESRDGPRKTSVLRRLAALLGQQLLTRS